MTNIPVDAFDYVTGANYARYSRDIAQVVEVNEAIVLAELIEEYRYWDKHHALDNGWFYATQDKIQEKTGLTYRKQQPALKRWEERGVITVQRRGVPAKRYFKINKSVLHNWILQNVITGQLRQNVESSYDEMSGQDTTKDARNKPLYEPLYEPYRKEPSSNEEEPFPPTGTTGVELNMKSSSNSCMGGPNGCSNEAAEAAAKAKPKKASKPKGEKKTDKFLRFLDEQDISEELRDKIKKWFWQTLDMGDRVEQLSKRVETLLRDYNQQDALIMVTYALDHATRDFKDYCLPKKNSYTKPMTAAQEVQAKVKSETMTAEERAECVPYDEFFKD